MTASRPSSSLGKEHLCTFIQFPGLVHVSSSSPSTENTRRPSSAPAQAGNYDTRRTQCLERDLDPLSAITQSSPEGSQERKPARVEPDEIRQHLHSLKHHVGSSGADEKRFRSKSPGDVSFASSISDSSMSPPARLMSSATASMLPLASSRFAAEADAESIKSFEQEIDTISRAIQWCLKNGPSWLLLNSCAGRVREELDAVRQNVDFRPRAVHVAAPSDDLGL